MAINIYWQNADGTTRYAVVTDKYYSMAKLWPIRESSYPLLQYVDEYGYTFFNHLQMPQVIAELEKLIGQATSEEQIEVLRRVCDVAKQCQKKAHTFLRFVGD